MAEDAVRRYPADVRARAVRMVRERASGESEWGAMARTASRLGVGSAETVRRWVRDCETDVAACLERVRLLEDENTALRRDRADLRLVVAVLAAEIGRGAARYFGDADR